MQSTMNDFVTGAEDIRWDLTDLYEDEEALHADVARAEREAATFAEDFRGSVSTLSGEELAAALRRFEAIQDRAGRAYTYVFLHWSTDTSAADRGALLQKVREAYTRIISATKRPLRSWSPRR